MSFRDLEVAHIMKQNSKKNMKHEMEAHLNKIAIKIKKASSHGYFRTQYKLSHIYEAEKCSEALAKKGYACKREIVLNGVILDISWDKD